MFRFPKLCIISDDLCTHSSVVHSSFFYILHVSFGLCRRNLHVSVFSFEIINGEDVGFAAKLCHRGETITAAHQFWFYTQKKKNCKVRGRKDGLKRKVIKKMLVGR